MNDLTAYEEKPHNLFHSFLKSHVSEPRMEVKNNLLLMASSLGIRYEQQKRRLPSAFIKQRPTTKELGLNFFSIGEGMKVKK